MLVETSLKDELQLVALEQVDAVVARVVGEPVELLAQLVELRDQALADLVAADGLRVAGAAEPGDGAGAGADHGEGLGRDVVDMQLAAVVGGLDLVGEEGVGVDLGDELVDRLDGARVIGGVPSVAAPNRPESVPVMLTAVAPLFLARNCRLPPLLNASNSEVGPRSALALSTASPTVLCAVVRVTGWPLTMKVVMPSEPAVVVWVAKMAGSPAPVTLMLPSRVGQAANRESSGAVVIGDDFAVGVWICGDRVVDARDGGADGRVGSLDARIHRPAVEGDGERLRAAGGGIDVLCRVGRDRCSGRRRVSAARLHCRARSSRIGGVEVDGDRADADGAARDAERLERGRSDRGVVERVGHALERLVLARLARIGAHRLDRLDDALHAEIGGLEGLDAHHHAVEEGRQVAGAAVQPRGREEVGRAVEGRVDLLAGGEPLLDLPLQLACVLQREKVLPDCVCEDDAVRHNNDPFWGTKPSGRALPENELLRLMKG